jgi:hypothetical protein
LCALVTAFFISSYYVEPSLTNQKKFQSVTYFA